MLLSQSLNQSVHIRFLLLLLNLHTAFSGDMVWYSHFFKNFPLFVMIHTVKGFSVVSETGGWFSGIPLLSL